MPVNSESDPGQRSASATATVVLNQPVGTISPFYGGQANLIPGWLLCDGSPFDGKVFPALASLLGKTTTPDLRGYFVRCLDPTGQVDPDGRSRQLGSHQDDAFGMHSHNYQKYQLPWDSGVGYSGGGNNFANVENVTGSAGGPETRPKNIALNYIIFAGFPLGQTS